MQTKTKENRSKPFVILAFSTGLLTIGLIIFGAVVRVTDSGLGCGNSWPLCNGTIFPPLDNITAWIEWLHRLFAALIGLLGIGMLVLAVQWYRKRDNRVLVATVIAAILFALQSILGAIVVVLDLPPTFVTLHLGVAMLLLAALLVAGMIAWYQPSTSYGADNVSLLAYMNAGFALLIILTGALVRGSGATLACTEWPLCNNGAILPFDQGQLAVIHMMHRLAVAALGATLLILVWQVLKNRSQVIVRQLAILAGVFYLLQAGVGAMFVLSVASSEWGALHVGLAATTWGLLVLLCVVETMNHQQVEISGTETEWQSQSKTA